jgi:putative pyruvate formate lyase activating enzyme
MVETPLLSGPVVAALHSARRTQRHELAAARAEEAHAHLRSCRLCAHRCGVDRLGGDTGPCHAGPVGRVFHAQAEVGDESDLAPLFAVAFSGCDLRCDFCNTGRESWDPSAGEPPDLDDPAGLAARIGRQADAGSIRSVMILGGEPTIHLPSALRLVARIPDSLPVIWKTNAHGTPESNALLDGVFDAWVADLKFGNDACARRIARVENYGRIVRENLAWAAPRTRLIVRHLLMPGHLDCCWRPVAEWIAGTLPRVEVSLRTGYWPGWFSSRHPELRRTGRVTEEREARRIGEALGLRLIQ